MSFDPPRLPPARSNPPRRRRSRRRALAAGGLWLAAAGPGWAAAPATLHLRCTNRASGASWPLVVDLAHRRVDSLSATITDKWISWHDPGRGHFDLERATGALQFRNASSTGGYFLHFVCRPERE
jgi:hypothetical protein